MLAPLAEITGPTTCFLWRRLFSRVCLRSGMLLSQEMRSRTSKHERPKQLRVCRDLLKQYGIVDTLMRVSPNDIAMLVGDALVRSVAKYTWYHGLLTPPPKGGSPNFSLSLSLLRMTGFAELCMFVRSGRSCTPTMRVIRNAGILAMRR